MGLDVTVVARVRAHRGSIEATGARVVPLDAERSSLNPMTAGYAAGQLAAILKAFEARYRPLHRLRAILVGGTAAAMAGVSARVFAVTGLGLIGARQDRIGWASRLALRSLIRGPLASKRTRFLFENPDDAVSLGLDPSDRTVTIIGGAGIDPPIARCDRCRPSRRCGSPSWRGCCGRRASTSPSRPCARRGRGVPVTLSLYGTPDPDNRRAIPEETLRSWSGEGIDWHGPTSDISAVWAEHHAACLPSRGGEGLPRTLLEAAAHGRACLTTDVPGCRTLVRDGIEGLVVPPGDAEALAAALARLASDPALVASLGTAARARIGPVAFTEAAVAGATGRLWRELLEA